MRASERWIAASVSLSTAEVASSSTSSAGSRYSARASAMRWRWPPDSCAPRSPDGAVVAAGQRGDEAMRLGRARRRLDRGAVRRRFAVGDVLGDGAVGEEELSCATVADRRRSAAGSSVGECRTPSK
jgi:hypothetical protein